MKYYLSFLLALVLYLLITCNNYAQSYQGPAAGSVSSGILQTTDSFFKTLGLTEPKEMIGNGETEGYRSPQFYMNLGKQSPEGSNYIKGVDQVTGDLNSNSILLKSF